MGDCTHGVKFDEEAAKQLAKEVPDDLLTPAIRKRWPRGWFTAAKTCAECGFVGIAYASMAHYVYGDW